MTSRERAVIEAAIEFVHFTQDDQKWLATPEDTRPTAVRASLAEYVALRQILHVAVEELETSATWARIPKEQRDIGRDAV